MLDEHGTGVVLTSINGRQETRVYAKPVAVGTEHVQPVGRRGRGDQAGDDGGSRGGRGSMIWRREDAESEHAEAPRVPAPGAKGQGTWPRTARSRSSERVRRLEGNVVSAGSLRIDGQVKGQINADGDVVLSPQSQVEADIRSQNVSVAGRFTGQHPRQGQGAPGARAGGSTGTSRRRPSSSKRAASSTGRATWTPEPGRARRRRRPRSSPPARPRKRERRKKPDQVKV